MFPVPNKRATVPNIEAMQQVKKKKKSLKHAKTKPLVKLIMFCLLADDKKSIGFKAFLCYINSHKHTSGNLHFSPIADGTVR